MKFKLGSLAKACVLLVVAGGAIASSHREAPGISNTPKVDGTDFYMFNSPDTAGNVALIANYLPLQDPYGGPNYFSLDPTALYEIHVDNNGDGKEDLTFQFRFKNVVADGGNGLSLDIGTPGSTKKVAIPLRQKGDGTVAANLAFTESYTVTVVKGDRRTGQSKTYGPFEKPIDNIGTKTFSNYKAYADSKVTSFVMDGCSTPVKVFAGQRKEAFAVNLGTIFDLVNAPAAVITAESNNSAYNNTASDVLKDKNVTSLAIELPATCLRGTGGDPVIGGWTTASVRQARLANGAPPSGFGNHEKSGGAWTQVSRLGMPLVNEVVIGLKDKDKFNASKPFTRDDLNDATNFADYVTNPTFPTLLEVLFGTKAPTNYPRKDLMTAFLTGVPGVNRPANYTGLGVGGPLAEMLRLNTNIAAKPRASENALGVIGGDSSGYPNGRRLGDDVIDITLRVAMGVLCVATGAADDLKVGCKPGDAPSGSITFVDGVRYKGTDFPGPFPYLNTPVPGAQ